MNWSGGGKKRFRSRVGLHITKPLFKNNNRIPLVDEKYLFEMTSKKNSNEKASTSCSPQTPQNFLTHQEKCSFQDGLDQDTSSPKLFVNIPSGTPLTIHDEESFDENSHDGESLTNYSPKSDTTIDDGCFITHVSSPIKEIGLFDSLDSQELQPKLQAELQPESSSEGKPRNTDFNLNPITSDGKLKTEFTRSSEKSSSLAVNPAIMAKIDSIGIYDSLVAPCCNDSLDCHNRQTDLVHKQVRFGTVTVEDERPRKLSNRDQSNLFGEYPKTPIPRSSNELFSSPNGNENQSPSTPVKENDDSIILSEVQTDIVGCQHENSMELPPPSLLLYEDHSVYQEITPSSGPSDNNKVVDQQKFYRAQKAPSTKTQTKWIRKKVVLKKKIIYYVYNKRFNSRDAASQT